MKVRAVEITFPHAVELTSDDQRALIEIADRACRRWVRKHPYSVMWPAGTGCKPTYIPMTAADEAERGMEFDEETFQIECFEREDYACPQYEG